MNRRILRPTLYTTLGLVLAACGQNAAPTISAAPTTYAVTVPLGAHTSAATLERRYGGDVTLFSPKAGFAVVRVDAATARRLQGDMKALSADGATIEANTDTFRIGVQASGGSLWAGGGSLWAGGGSLWAGGGSLWAGGGSLWAGGGSLWAGGQYDSMPENTQPWTQVKLDTVHPDLGNLAMNKRVRVAVLDSGIDLAHPAFTNALAPAATHRDFIDGDSVPQEVGGANSSAYGHGTNVAGIVVQVSPTSEILPIRVLDADGTGDTDVVASAIVYAVDQGAKVVNLSLGAAEASAAVTAALQYAADHGVYVVAAVGNENRSGANYPAAQSGAAGTLGDHLVGVGSVNAQDGRSSFSNFGTGTEIVAPGERIMSPAPDRRQVAWSGTSQATPVVAGALALALSSDKLNTSLVTPALLATADNVSTLNPGVALGSGRLNVRQFITTTTR